MTRSLESTRVLVHLPWGEQRWYFWKHFLAMKARGCSCYHEYESGGSGSSNLFYNNAYYFDFPCQCHEPENWAEFAERMGITA